MGRGPVNHVLLENPPSTWVKKPSLSQGAHSQRGLPQGCCPCPQLPFSKAGSGIPGFPEGIGGTPKPQVWSFCLFLGVQLFGQTDLLIPSCLGSILAPCAPLPHAKGRSRSHGAQEVSHPLSVPFLGTVEDVFLS